MLLLTLSLLTSGCASTTTEVATCPALVKYSDEFQDAAQAEYDDMKAKDIYPRSRKIIDDGGDLRAQVRACNKAAR